MGEKVKTVLSTILIIIVAVSAKSCSRELASSLIGATQSKPQTAAYESAPATQSAATQTTATQVDWSWSSEAASIGSANVHYMIPSSTLFNCRSLSVWIRAEALRGASSKGDWNLYIKTGNSWEKVATVYIDNNEGYVDLALPTAKNIYGITAVPTRPGSYSWETAFAFDNIICD